MPYHIVANKKAKQAALLPAVRKPKAIPKPKPKTLWEYSYAIIANITRLFHMVTEEFSLSSLLLFGLN